MINSNKRLRTKQKKSKQKNVRNKNRRNTKNFRNRKRVNKSIKYGGMQRYNESWDTLSSDSEKEQIYPMPSKNWVIIKKFS